MDKLAQKRNASSMQVLKTLRVLMEGNYGMNELITKLNSQEKTPVFNNSVISKYINTCRFCGIDIPKVLNKYYVAYVPFGLKFDDDEISLLQVIQAIVKKTMSGNSINLFDSFLKKLNQFSAKKIARIEPKDYHMSFELFQRAVNQRRKVKLIFKNRYELEGIPLGISKGKGKIFFEVFNRRVRKIDATRLTGIETLSDRFIEPQIDTPTVIFKLKGGLAKRYTIRGEYETLVTPLSLEGEITIANKGENKNALLSRLMRYDDQCELVSPKSYRDDMKQMIADTLKNYGE